MSGRLEDLMGQLGAIRRVDQFDQQQPSPFGVPTVDEGSLGYLKMVRAATDGQIELARLLERSAWPAACGPLPPEYDHPDHIPGPLYLHQAMMLTVNEGMRHTLAATMVRSDVRG